MPRADSPCLERSPEKELPTPPSQFPYTQEHEPKYLVHTKVSAMAATSSPTSALTSFMKSNIPPKSTPTHNPHHQNLASQIFHNLQHQHDWTSLQIHTHSPNAPSPLPRPLISGLPPRRIYVHPDEQVEMLRRRVKEQDVPLEREWVLPTHLREKWSLRRFAEVFDAVGTVPPGENAEGESNNTRRGGKRVLLATVGDDSTVLYYIVHDGIVKPRQN